MKSTVETLSPTRVRLAIEVPFAELEPSLKKAYREIASQVNIPGFRKGKVPSQVIDQRVGRGAVLQEAVEDMHPAADLRGGAEHDVKLLGRPDRGQSRVLRRPAAEVHRRGGRAPRAGSARAEQHQGRGRPAGGRRLGDRRAARRAAREVRDAQDRRACGRRRRLRADRPRTPTVDGAEVEGGSATNLSHQVGSGTLLNGLDEAVVGPVRRRVGDLHQPAGGRRARGQGRRRQGDRPHRQGEGASRPRRRLRPAGQRVRHAGASCAATSRSGSPGSRRSSSSTPPATRPRPSWSPAPPCPRPRVSSPRRSRTRKQAMVDQLERMGASLEEYLRGRGEDRGADRRRADRGRRRGRAHPAGAGHDRRAGERPGLRRRVRSRDRAPGPARRHAARSSTTTSWSRPGAAAAVYGDVRRGKALALVMERVIMTDTNGEVLTLDALRGGAGATSTTTPVTNH